MTTATRPAKRGTDASGGAEWAGLLRMPWTEVPISPVPRRAHFRRPPPDVLPGLISGEYEGTRIPPHTHEALLVVLPVTRFVMLGGGAVVHTGPGDICLSNMLELHGAIAGAMRCQARFFLVSPDLLHEVARAVDDQGSMIPHFGSMPLADPALAQAFSAVWEELERPVRSSDVARHCRTLLQELVHQHGDADGPPRGGNRKNLAIRRVQQHLQRHVPDPLSLHDLARMAGVSKAYLVREFHRTIGLPPHAYHVQLRIARAARLLAMGLPLSRVAFEAGFADQSHLSRRFKAAYGLTPLGFARAVRSATGPAPDIAKPSQWPGAIAFNNAGHDAARRVV
jgi:AraC-like DNA-binding protein